ncbi:MAG: hypothetical protein NT178_08280 [Proteobacteria bacterium]|nr:hypothetical protein [Pseudomonadota bacterium]
MHNINSRIYGKSAIKDVEVKHEKSGIGKLLLLMNFSSVAHSEENNLEQCILNFNYQERKEMKIDSKELIKLIKKVQFIDIRFKD